MEKIANFHFMPYLGPNFLFLFLAHPCHFTVLLFLLFLHLTVTNNHPDYPSDYLIGGEHLLVDLHGQHTADLTMGQIGRVNLMLRLLSFCSQIAFSCSVHPNAH